MKNTRRVIKEFSDSIVTTIIEANVNSELDFEITSIELQTNYGDIISEWSKNGKGPKIKDLRLEIFEYFDNEFANSLDISDWINAKNDDNDSNY
jgi:hypothetical protein